MSNRARLAVAALAVVAIVVAFILASGSEDAQTPTQTPTETTQATTEGATVETVTATTQTSSSSATPVITVRDGKPLNDVERLSFKVGDRVRFIVRSNRADEVHVHGYDIEKEVPAGGAVTFSFDASIDGIFEIELHSNDTQIAELEVSP